jgi:hypothetical protein
MNDISSMNLDPFFDFDAEENLAVAAEEASFAEFPPEIYSLTPSLEGQLYESLKALIRTVNIHAEPQEYAVVLTRTKCSKKGVKRKAFLRCDRGEKSFDVAGKRRVHESSRLIECLFSMTTKLKEDEDSIIKK